MERITGDLLTAARQWRAGNPDREFLNFVVLVNRDAEASADLLAKLLAPKRTSAGRSLKARRQAISRVQSRQYLPPRCLGIHTVATGCQ